MRSESKPAAVRPGESASPAEEPPEAAARKPAVARPGDAEARQAVLTLLRWIGEDPAREGLLETPDRVLRAWREDYFTGYGPAVSAAGILSKTFAETEGYAGAVVLRGIDVYSTCEHHLAPIRGSACVAYLPAGKVVGLSKIVRLCEHYARRMQTQERLTAQIANAIARHLDARGAAVAIEAEHFCMSSRGVHRPGVVTRTECTAGDFRETGWTREALLARVAPDGPAEGGTGQGA